MSTTRISCEELKALCHKKLNSIQSAIRREENNLIHTYKFPIKNLIRRVRKQPPLSFKEKKELLGCNSTFQSHLDIIRHFTYGRQRKKLANLIKLANLSSDGFVYISEDDAHYLR